MKVLVKTLKGTNFQIEVKLEDTVADVKKNIETVQGSDVYPASQQMLIHQGKVLQDDTTMEENKVSEKSFIVIMFSKRKSSSAPPPIPVPAPPPQPPSSTVIPQSANPYSQAASNLVEGINLPGVIHQILEMVGGRWDRDIVVRALQAAFNNPERAVEYLYSGIPLLPDLPPLPAALSPPQPTPQSPPSVINPPQPTQSPPRSVNPPQATPPPPPAVNPPQVTHAPPPQATQSPPIAPTTGPNANPLNLFPQGVPSGGAGGNRGAGGPLDFLRDIPQFQVLRSRVQSDPQILQPILQDMGRKYPNLLRLFHEHRSEFIRVLFDSDEEEEDEWGQGGSGVSVSMTITVTREEMEAIERLEELGFSRSVVLETYLAFDKNEEMAANFLLDNMD